MRATGKILGKIRRFARSFEIACGTEIKNLRAGRLRLSETGFAIRHKAWNDAGVPRKPISRPLPPLGDLFGKPMLTEECNKQQVVLEQLRKAAKRLRKRKSQPFYSMREIAAFFQASLRTVALAYEDLEQEGLLDRLRGSKTMLIGTADMTQNLIRGVVGIPMWLHSIVMSPFTRVMWMELDERLRKNGFVADFIFFRTGEDCLPDFGERLLNHNLNFVIWHTPHPLAYHVRLFMQDHGIRQIIIQMKESPASKFPPAYLMDWQPAYQAMATSWQNAGIRHVIIPRPLYLPSQQALKNFRRFLGGFGMETEVVEGDAQALLANVRDNKITAVAFFDQQGANPLCNENPAVIEEISKVARLAFCRGLIRLPYFEDRPMRVDIVGFSPIEMAERIAGDLCKRSKAEADKPHTFEAAYLPEKAFSEVADAL